MQQAEHITESEVDIEKKKQELYSEIDALGIKSDSRINKLKKFLADRKIWHLEEMDYPLRNSYEQYLRGQIRSQIVSFYLKIYDTVKQQHIYQQMQTLNGKRIYEWKYQNKIYFLKYYPEKEIAETFETSYKTNLLVWDFTQNCSEVLKKQIFYTLSRIIANTSMSKAYRNVRLKSLKLLYDSCVQLNITDIGLLEMEQVETILKNFPETSQRSILGECRRDAFMQQEQIQWEANVWYLERLHLGKHRIDESKSLISISFMEVKEIQNREILQAYMKYELGITGQAVSTIVRRFVCIRNFGESGSGKSTLAKLLIHYYDPQKGSISIGGQKLCDMSLEALNSRISYVAQDQYLFNTSLLENIRLGRLNATDEEVVEAAKKAQCMEFLETLPQGIHSMAGDAGKMLSGGQRQRISLARAILKDAPIVVLDEATAYADPENEEKMEAAIAELVKGKTLVVIAHKLPAIMNADQICVMDHGKLVATGRHQELIQSCPEYQKLWKAAQDSAEWKVHTAKEGK